MKETSFFIRPVTGADIDNLLQVYQDCEDFLAPGLKPKPTREMVLKDLEASKTPSDVDDDFGTQKLMRNFQPGKASKIFNSLTQHSKLKIPNSVLNRFFTQMGYQITADPHRKPDQTVYYLKKSL